VLLPPDEPPLPLPEAPLVPLPDDALLPLSDDPLLADELLPAPEPEPLPVELDALLPDEPADDPLPALPADAVFMPEAERFVVAAEPVVRDSYRDEMPRAAIVDESR